MQSFWNDLPRPFFILAPMEAVTDVVFRHVVASAARPDIFFTEFTNASSYCSPKGQHSTRGRLAFTPDEHPMVAQIWGDKPDEFATMAKGLAEMGYKGIDINMGCPVKNAVKSGGSGLIRQPELAAQLIAAAKEGGLPVSVKTRLGYSHTDEWRDWLTHILKQDVVNLSIHLRTRKEMSKVPAHFELIPEIKKLRDEIAPHTLLTINGDIRDRQHGEELVKEYGIDGIMIGRGVFTNPFAFETEPRQHDREELLGLLNLHLDLFDKYSEELEPRNFEPLKRFFKIYVRNFAGAGELRMALMNTRATDEARALLQQALRSQNAAPGEGHSSHHSPESPRVKAIIFTARNGSSYLAEPSMENEQLLRSWREQGIKLYLFESSNHTALRRSLENFETFFDDVITVSDDPSDTFDSDTIDALLRRIAVAPEEAIVVSDHPHDIQSGQNARAGLKVGISHDTAESREQLGAGADALAEDLSGVNTLIATEG